MINKYELQREIIRTIADLLKLEAIDSPELTPIILKFGSAMMRIVEDQPIEGEWRDVLIDGDVDPILSCETEMVLITDGKTIETGFWNDDAACLGTFESSEFKDLKWLPIQSWK